MYYSFCVGRQGFGGIWTSNARYLLRGGPLVSAPSIPQKVAVAPSTQQQLRNYCFSPTIRLQASKHAKKSAMATDSSKMFEEGGVRVAVEGCVGHQPYHPRNITTIYSHHR